MLHYKTQYEEFKLIVNTEFDQVTIADQNGVFLRIEHNCENTFGIPEAEMIGKSATELEKKRIFSKSVTLAVLKNKKVISMIQDTAAGKRLMVKGIPMFKNGDLFRIINLSRDITEIEKLNQRLEDTEEMLDWFRQELLKKQTLESNYMSFNSQKMVQITELVRYIADSEAVILLLGETGTGKSFFAQTIHQLSSRRLKPFVHINCGSIPESLLESELFGYESGAFTGANTKGKKGLLEIAKDGTVFFDEIAEIPNQIQVKLLNVLQEKKFYKIGGLVPEKVNARIITATNKDLKKLVSEGKFREDLYYRLNVLPITIPPLRKRAEDIPALAKFFLDKFNKKYGFNKVLTSTVYNTFLSYQWPGNIRELENTIERLVVVNQNDIIDQNAVIEFIEMPNNNDKLHIYDIVPLKNAISEVEKSLLIMALDKYKSTRKMAEALEIDQSTVVKKLKKHNIRNLV